MKQHPEIRKAWKERIKKYNEGNKLIDEGNMILAQAEKEFLDAVNKVHGNIGIEVTTYYRPGTKIVSRYDYDYVLANGEKYMARGKDKGS